jgi:hypothetical protein
LLWTNDGKYYRSKYSTLFSFTLNIIILNKLTIIGAFYELG